MEEAFPHNRSITGDGVRATFDTLSQVVPYTIHEVPTGTQVFDWAVPNEWNVTEAWIKGPDGSVVVDFAESNLHLVSYSVPIETTMTLDELRPHLHSLPSSPDLIPYRKDYFGDTWGFCLRHRDLERLVPGDYEVCIRSTVEPGSLTYGEYVIPGEIDDEILISTHCCHPSLANDNLSGLAVATVLADRIRRQPMRHTVRVLVVPSTIGSITFLARNRERIPSIRHGLVLACLGDPGNMTYKRSRRTDAEIDRAAAHVLERSGDPYEIFDFEPFGYDERQYCSPGINLAVGGLCRTPHGGYPEYHTSRDDLAYVSDDSLVDSLFKLEAILRAVDRNETYHNTAPMGEPQLSGRGLDLAFGGAVDQASVDQAVLWVLNFSDGSNSLLDIAERSSLPFDAVRAAADALLAVELLSATHDDRTLRERIDEPA
jgi:aminopeptidase-like protein